MEHDEARRRVRIIQMVALVTLMCILCALALAAYAHGRGKIAFNTAQLVFAEEESAACR